jgi:hypothetical protein
MRAGGSRRSRSIRPEPRRTRMHRTPSPTRRRSRSR